MLPSSRGRQEVSECCLVLGGGQRRCFWNTLVAFGSQFLWSGMNSVVVNKWVFAFGQSLVLSLNKELKMGITVFSSVFFPLWVFETKTKRFWFEQFWLLRLWWIEIVSLMLHWSVKSVYYRGIFCLLFDLSTMSPPSEMASVCFFFFAFFAFLGLHLRQMEVPRLGVKSEL